MKIISWLNELYKEDISIAGGKGASLGEMFNNKMPVPDAFVITAQTYEEFVAQLKESILHLLKGLDVEDTKRLDKQAKKIQELIINQEISQTIKDEILTAYKKLKGFVAVRSSATAEDLPSASFAGQQATFLNVKGEANLLDSVRECWASLFTARAIYYREKQNFDHSESLIAVVVQKMVEAKKAGVMFTVNPITNHKDEMIIEAAFGLGEAVVSGLVTPDLYLIGKNPLSIKEKTVNEQTWMLTKDKTGKTSKQEITNGNDQVLTDKEITEIYKLGKQLEDYYGSPQDIEWAIDDKVHLLQSRPITTFKS